MNIDFYMPARLISADQCVKTGGDIFKSFGDRCLIVTGKSSAKFSGALEQVTETLKEQGIAYSVFSEINQNPTVDSCLNGGQRAREYGAGFIIGIGGGSPLDAAKAVAIFAANPEFTAADIYTRSIPAKALPVLLVGTTSGTGSEVTGVSVLTDSSSGMKRSISGADCYAKVCFLNPRFTDSMPMDTTVSTGLDALSHAVESWFSPKSSEISKACAKLALPKLYRGLFDIYKYDRLPGKKARDELYYASIYAGLALNITGAAFPHTIGYVLTEDFGVAHGRACTAFMPALISRAQEFCEDRLNGLLDAIGTDENGFIDTVKGLTDVKISVPDGKIAEYCKRWNSKTKNFLNSPGGFSESEAYKALKTLSGI